MKIRALTLFLTITSSIIDDEKSTIKIIEEGKKVLNQLKKDYEAVGYEVQTIRITLNSFEEYLLLPEGGIDMKRLERLVNALIHNEIDFCSIGDVVSEENILLIPTVLSYSTRLYCNVNIQRDQVDNIYSIPNCYSRCYKAAKVVFDILQCNGELGNFNYCIGFNCQPCTPFYPVSYNHRSSSGNSGSSISIALESGDLLFLAFHGAESIDEGSNNLENTLHQVLQPIETIAADYCQRNQVIYNGIDASINPGITLPDSVGFGLENILSLFPVAPDDSNVPQKTLREFGQYGTTAAVAAVTAGIKLLQAKNAIKLVGYNGLMLPIMEDVVLAERTNFTIRDILLFSTICGVGIDTVPIPGNTKIEELACLYMEIVTLAFRLNKPLSCRVLPMLNKEAGDMTNVNSNYLKNTKVVAV